MDESITLPCPLCQQDILLADAEDGQEFPCPHCEEPLRFQDPEEEVDSALVGLCSACQEIREAGDSFCQHCGVNLGGDAEGESLEPVGQQPPPIRRRRGATRAKHAQKSRATSMRQASVIVLIVAILYAVVGAIAGYQNQQEANDALLFLELADEGEILEMDDGTEIAVADLRKEIQADVTMVYVVMFGLSALMLACWFWSRQSPLPALMTALGIYVTVLTLSAIADPSTLLSGVILKAIVIAALVAGVRAALRERALMEGA